MPTFIERGTQKINKHKKEKVDGGSNQQEKNRRNCWWDHLPKGFCLLQIWI
jgi:hypothetical protein